MTVNFQKSFNEPFQCERETKATLVFLKGFLDQAIRNSACVQHDSVDQFFIVFFKIHYFQVTFSDYIGRGRRHILSVRTRPTFWVRLWVASG